MKGRVDPWSFESVGDVLEYLAFAGFPTTRDQLGRLQRRQLVARSVVGPGDHHGTGVYLPGGTAERTRRVLELRAGSKHAEDLVWRLWWEGYDVDLDVVRAYLAKRASRWDEQVRDLHPAGTEPEEAEDPETGRDVVEEVFFRHLKANQTLVAARRRVVRGSEFYVDFVALITDLVSGQVAPTESRVGLFGVLGEGGPAGLRAGARAALVMRRDLELSYGELAGSMSDDELLAVRDVAARYLALVSRIGTILHDAYGGGQRGRDALSHLISWADSPDEQVLATLLTSSLVHDPRAQEVLPVLTPLRPAVPAVGFRDFVRLRYLATSVPGLSALLTPERGGEAFSDEEGAARWRADVDQVRYLFSEEVAWAMGEWPELFDLGPPDDEEEEAESAPRVTAKKKIQKRGRR